MDVKLKDTVPAVADLDNCIDQKYTWPWMMARKTFKFRLYPNRQQREKLTATLELCRELYNAGLQERIEAWRNRTSIKVFDQMNQLPEIKEIRPDVAGVFSQVLQDVLRRIDKTYQAFFLRIKRGQKAGFPRFKGSYRYDSFTYPQSGFALGSRLRENAGRQFLKVDPKHTSQECPNCYAIKKKSLSDRIHRCDCGLTIGRDHAAALVILGRGLRLQAQTKPEVRACVA